MKDLYTVKRYAKYMHTEKRRQKFPTSIVLQSNYFPLAKIFFPKEVSNQINILYEKKKGKVSKSKLLLY